VSIIKVWELYDEEVASGVSWLGLSVSFRAVLKLWQL